MNDVEQSIGQTLGYESVEKTVEQIERYCEYEKKRIESSNLAALKAGRAEIALLLERKEQLEGRIRQLPPSGDIRMRRRYALAYWALVAMLVTAGTYFTKLSFDPFRSATNPYVYSVGIALTITFLGDMFLSAWGKHANQILKIVIITAFSATLIAMGFLAVIRGDLLMQRLKDESSAAVTIDDSPTTPAPPSENTFYEESAALLCLTLPLLAVGMDLGAGLALHEAKRVSAKSPDDPGKLAVALDSVHQQMIAKLSEVTSLETAPKTFECGFWRDFYHSMLTHTARNAMKKLFVLAFVIAIPFANHVFAQESTNMVILVDLSKSVAVKGPQGESPCQKNFRAIGRVLETVPAGSRITILGITADSFGNPDILLSAEISGDSGYFGEKLASAHQVLLVTWQKRSQSLECNAYRTDILGALLVASQVFKEHTASRDELVIFSDMRQDTNKLNLAILPQLVVGQEMRIVLQQGLVSDLRDVDVYMLGVDNSGKDLTAWKHLREFWQEYLKAANARVEQYSVLNNIYRRWAAKDK